MNLHEYQAKQLLASHGVEVPGGQPCTTADEARNIAEGLFAAGQEMVVLK
ncbi:MAG: succinate--CoA ligase subunit beta, partial [Verrucomicrobia bacterium]|nr:succinate--CoA ligase subunit beta [Verrucomicrobiota bacterium]